MEKNIIHYLKKYRFMSIVFGYTYFQLVFSWIALMISPFYIALWVENGFEIVNIAHTLTAGIQLYFSLKIIKLFKIASKEVPTNIKIYFFQQLLSVTAIYLVLMVIEIDKIGIAFKAQFNSTVSIYFFTCLYLMYSNTVLSLYGNTATKKLFQYKLLDMEKAT